MLNGTRIDLQEAFEEDQNVVLGGRNGFILNKLGVLYFFTRAWGDVNKTKCKVPVPKAPEFLMNSQLRN